MDSVEVSLQGRRAGLRWTESGSQADGEESAQSVFRYIFNVISPKIQHGLEWQFSDVSVSGTFFTI